jgi:hypothetical protein
MSTESVPSTLQNADSRWRNASKYGLQLENIHTDGASTMTGFQDPETGFF